MFTNGIRAITRTLSGESQLIGLDMVSRKAEDILKGTVNSFTINRDTQTYLDIDGNTYKYQSNDLEPNELEKFMKDLPNAVNPDRIEILCEFIEKERTVSHVRHGFMKLMKDHEHVLDMELTDEERNKIYDNDDYLWEQIDDAMYGAIKTKIKERNKKEN